VRPRRREEPLSEYAVIQTQFRDAAVLAAALTDLGFPARPIEWHEEPAVLRGPTIEVPGYAQLVVRGRHVGPGANDLTFLLAGPRRHPRIRPLPGRDVPERPGVARGDGRGRV
jgi:hypothetical protein